MVRDYVALDLETTGLNPNSDRILEIGAVKFINGEAVEEYDTFVDCRMKIPEMITRLTGIDNSMVEGAMKMETAVEKLVAFCEGMPILGHNILFDYSFIKRQAVNQGLEFQKLGIDTLKIAKNCLNELPSRRLDALCSHYGICQENHHRALDDAWSAVKLYDKLAEEFAEAFPRSFIPQEMIFQVKKQSPITNSQKVYLNDLVKYHRIDLDVRIDSLTKNDASRMIDKIILENGRIKR